jgi:hypothetical protein
MTIGEVPQPGTLSNAREALSCYGRHLGILPRFPFFRRSRVLVFDARTALLASQ